MPEATPVLQKMLKFVKLFAGFSEQDAADFLRVARSCQRQAGDFVLREGEFGSEAYIVASGQLRVLASCDGAEDELAVLGPGDTFGELGLLNLGPRSASVVAQTDVTLLRFDRLALASIPEVATRVLDNLVALVAERLRATSRSFVAARITLARMSREPEPGEAAVPQLHGPRVLHR